MSSTPILNLPEILSSQAQKEVTHNIALRIAEAVIAAVVQNSTLTTPPATPADGDMYIVATGGTNEWAGQDNNLAIAVSGIWYFVTPPNKFTVYNVNSSNFIEFDSAGSTWNTANLRKTVLNGTIDPTSADGSDGDFYINTATWQIFGPKAAGAWPAGVSLVGPAGQAGPAGPAGADGNTILSGTVDPTAADGVDGDFYINTSTWTIFGPKAAGAWPAGTPISGGGGGAPAQNVVSLTENIYTQLSYTAAAGDMCIVHLVNGTRGYRIWLPSAPNLGDKVSVFCDNGAAYTTQLQITPGGGLAINGSTASRLVSVNTVVGETYTFVGGTVGWAVLTQ